MNVQAEAKNAAPKSSVKFHERLAGASLVESVAFAGGEHSSVNAGRNCDSLIPARLEPDGTAVSISSGQRADGLLVRRKVQNLNTREFHVDQVFIPFANIRGLLYGE